VNLVLELRPPESRLYGSWEERLAAVSRFSRPDEVHAVCEKAHALGARSVLAVLDDSIREALVAYQRWRDMALWAVVPNGGRVNGMRLDSQGYLIGADYINHLVHRIAIEAFWVSRGLPGHEC